MIVPYWNHCTYIHFPFHRRRAPKIRVQTIAIGAHMHALQTERDERREQRPPGERRRERDGNNNNREQAMHRQRRPSRRKRTKTTHREPHTLSVLQLNTCRSEAHGEERRTQSKERRKRTKKLVFLFSPQLSAHKHN